MLSIESAKLAERLKFKVQQSNIGQRMARGAFWSFTGTAMAKAIVMLAGILCARILGKEIYGQYGLVKNTINTFMVLGGSGLGYTATKYISEFKQNSKERVPSIYYVTNGFAGIMAVVVLLLLYCLSDMLAINVLHTPSLGFSLRIASVILIFVVINVAQEGVLVGFEDFKGKAIATFAGSICQAIALLTCAYQWGLNGAIMGYGIGYCIIALLNKYFIDRNFSRIGEKQSLKLIRKEDFKLLIKFTLPAALSSMLIAPVFFLLRLMIKRYTDFSAMADYDVGEQWKLLILFVPTSICAIVLPILSSINKDQKKKFWKILNVNLMINGGAAAILALLVVLCSGLITSLYGENFNNPMPLIILSVSCVFTSMSAVLGSSIASLARMWASCFLNLIWASVMVGLAYLFLEMGMGTTGVSLAILLSYIEHLLVQYCYLRVVHRQD